MTQRLPTSLFACLPLALATLTGLSCRTSTGVDPGTTDAMFFETEYVNYAWGFTYRGTTLDANGIVLSYDPGTDTTMVLRHPNEMYTGEELSAKYAHHPATITTICPDSVQRFMELARAVSACCYSDTTLEGADMGEITYSVYRFQNGTRTYQRTVLAVLGDHAFANTDHKAEVIVEWLRKLPVRY